MENVKSNYVAESQLGSFFLLRWERNWIGCGAVWWKIYSCFFLLFPRVTFVKLNRKITEVRWNFFAQFDKPCLLGGSANKFRLLMCDKNYCATISPTGPSPFIVVHVHNDSEDKSSINIEALKLESVTRTYSLQKLSMFACHEHKFAVHFMELHALK